MVPTTGSNPQTPAECPQIQLNFDTVYPETVRLGLKMLFENPGCYLCFWPTGYRLKVPTTPHLRLPITSLGYKYLYFWSIGWGAEVPTAPTWGLVCQSDSKNSLDHQFTLRKYSYNYRNRQMEEMQTARKGITFSISLSLYQPQGSPNPLFGGFIDVSLHEPSWQNHWPWVTDATSLPLSLPPRVGGYDWKVQPPNYLVGPTGIQPPFLGAFQKASH